MRSRAGTNLPRAARLTPPVAARRRLAPPTLSLLPTPLRLASASAAVASDDSWIADYRRDGCAVVPGFADLMTTASMMESMATLIEAWDPQSSRNSVFHVNSAEGAAADAGGDEAALQRDLYFFDTAEKQHGFFLNPGAIDEATDGVRTDIPKAHLLNKVGHALHVNDPVFRAYSQGKAVAELVAKLGYTQPVMPQSMYIFKQPLIGEQVSSHQDATFLNTEPELTCMGLLLFLEDATLENGCLWARKGSHLEPLRQRWERNPDWFAAVEAGGSTAGIDAMTFVPLDDGTSPAQEMINSGALGSETSPENIAALRGAGYTELPVKAGDLVLIHGKVDHLSLANNSPVSRHTYQLHLVEGGPQSQWRGTNWQQYDSLPEQKLHRDTFQYE